MTSGSNDTDENSLHLVNYLTDYMEACDDLPTQVQHQITRVHELKAQIQMLERDFEITMRLSPTDVSAEDQKQNESSLTLKAEQILIIIQNKLDETIEITKTIQELLHNNSRGLRLGWDSLQSDNDDENSPRFGEEPAVPTIQQTTSSGSKRKGRPCLKVTKSKNYCSQIPLHVKATSFLKQAVEPGFKIRQHSSGHSSIQNSLMAIIGRGNNVFSSKYQEQEALLNMELKTGLIGPLTKPEKQPEPEPLPGPSGLQSINVGKYPPILKKSVSTSSIASFNSVASERRSETKTKKGKLSKSVSMPKLELMVNTAADIPTNSKTTAVPKEKQKRKPRQKRNPNQSQNQPKKRRRRRRRGRKKESESETEEWEDATDLLVFESSTGMESNNPATLNVDPPPDPDEILYCICRDVYHGTMTGCENDLCPVEWYHNECIGLPPDLKVSGIWYCPRCRLGDRHDMVKSKEALAKDLDDYNKAQERGDN